MKQLRLIIYEGTETALEAQISKSLPNGVNHPNKGMSITVVDLGTLPDWLALVTDQLQNEGSDE